MGKKTRKLKVGDIVETDTGEGSYRNGEEFEVIKVFADGGTRLRPTLWIDKYYPDEVKFKRHARSSMRPRSQVSARRKRKRKNVAPPRRG